MVTTIYIDTLQSVKKPLYYPRFSSHLQDDAVELAYGASVEIDPDQNISITDRSYLVPENSPDIADGEESFNSRYFSSYYGNILFTDKYTTSIPSQPLLPLFYKHVLPANTVEDSVYVLDNGFQRINQYLYTVETVYMPDEDGDPTAEVENVIVYNDLANSVDEDSGRVVVYYVQYTDDKSITHTELLNNVQVFNEATYSDVDWAAMELKSWLDTYTVRWVSNHYEYTLSHTSEYTVRYQSSSRIAVLGPASGDKTSTWFPRVINGKFTYNYNGETYVYSVPEFENQDFSPYSPYKSVVDEEVFKVASGLVQLKHVPLYVTDTSVSPIEILIQDTSGSVIYALTTDDSRHGEVYSGSINWDANKILSYDCLSGLVQIDLPIKDYYTMLATYHYKETYYEYTLLNLNPLNNTDIIGNTYVVYLVPQAPANHNESSQEASIEYLLVDKNGIIQACSQNGDSGNPDIVSGIDDIIGDPYGRGGQTTDSFLYKYTLESTELSGLSPGLDTRYLILAEITVSQHTNPEEVTILDTRVRGGGIKDSLDSEAKQHNAEVAWFNDIGFGGGISYPGRASVIVRLPFCLLTEYGGRFDINQLREIVKRHMPFGSYPVIRFYGVIPQISLDTEIVNGEITINWPSEGTGVTFNVYLKEGNVWVLQNPYPLEDDIAGNSYTITGVNPGNKYTISVRAIVENACGYLFTEANACGGERRPGGNGGGGIGTENVSSVEGPQSNIIEVVASEWFVPTYNTTSSVGHSLVVATEGGDYLFWTASTPS